MADDDQIYEFVGGSLDGHRLRIGGSLYSGATWPGQSVPGRKREIYVLHPDGRFRFDRFGLEFNPELGKLEIIQEQGPIMERLRMVLADLDTMLEAHGGPDATEYVIGNWKIRHKDA